VFPELGEEVINTVQAPHLEIAVQQSDLAGVPGSLVTLIAEVRLPPDTHVYAPGTQGYKPIELVIDPAPNLEFRPTIYPPSQVLFLPAINERVPVFEGTFRIRQDVKISTAAEFSSALGAQGKELTIVGTVRYQACDSKTCFLPARALVQWQLKVLPLDRQRAPEEIRHK
jgi:Disulphide bond corrector protein DsbC